jgi:hypothetical protein
MRGTTRYIRAKHYSAWVRGRHIIAKNVFFKLDDSWKQVITVPHNNNHYFYFAKPILPVSVFTNIDLATSSCSFRSACQVHCVTK